MEYRIVSFCNDSILYVTDRDDLILKYTDGTSETVYLQQVVQNIEVEKVFKEGSLNFRQLIECLLTNNKTECLDVKVYKLGLFNSKNKPIMGLLSEDNAESNAVFTLYNSLNHFKLIANYGMQKVISVDNSNGASIIKTFIPYIQNLITTREQCKT